MGVSRKALCCVGCWAVNPTPLFPSLLFSSLLCVSSCIWCDSCNSCYKQSTFRSTVTSWYAPRQGPYKQEKPAIPQIFCALVTTYSLCVCWGGGWGGGAKSGTQNFTYEYNGNTSRHKLLPLHQQRWCTLLSTANQDQNARVASNAGERWSLHCRRDIVDRARISSRLITSVHSELKILSFLGFSEGT